MVLPITLSRKISHILLGVRLRALGSSMALPLILGTAFVLRIYGIDWDDGQLLHADERAVLMHVHALELPPVSNLGVLLDAEKSPWNPGWFPYGSLPLYLLKSVQQGLSPLFDLDLSDLRFIGRSISALADVGTVMVVYFLGIRCQIGRNSTQPDRRVALIAAALTALAIIHIQLSHFYTVDTLLTFFVVLALYCLVRVSQDGIQRWWVLAGLAIGLAIATKVSSIPLLAPLLLTVPLVVIQRRRRLKSQFSLGELYNPTLGLTLALVIGLVANLIAQPYAFLDWGQFWGDLSEQREMVQRIRDYPFTRQYIGTIPYLYQIQQLSFFGLGPLVGLTAWAGLLFISVRCLVRREGTDLLLCAWVVPYFLIVGAFPVKFMRYLLPITPLLLLFGSQLLVGVLDWTGEHRKSLRPWVRVLVVSVLVTAGFYALAYISIYSQPHPAIRASEWMTAQGLSADAVVLREHWDDALPYSSQYQVKELPLYEPDSTEKFELIADRLAGGDYLILYSSRLYGSIPRLPHRYPQSTRYYELLLQEHLGYQLVHTETSYPSLPGIVFTNNTFSRPELPSPEVLTVDRLATFTVDMGYADDSFVVFDHPKVMIFQNIDRLPKGTLELLINQQEMRPEYDQLLMPSDEWVAQQAGGTWREILPPKKLSARFPIPIWFLIISGISLIALPLTLTIFRFLPDRGYLLAKPLGILLIAYVPWLLASLKWSIFSGGSIFLSFSLLAILSSWLVFHHREEFIGFLRNRWRLLLAEEVLFVAAFLGFTFIRMNNPDLWHPWFGGEKPLDMAYLNGVVRSNFMPPYDPWFAGGSINYYYLGYFLVALLVKITSIAPAIAYNLAVPLFFAMTVGGAFSLGYNLAEGTRQALPQKQIDQIPTWSPLVAAFGAVFLVAILGNLDGATQLIQGLFGHPSNVGSFPIFDYWQSSRMIPPDPPGYEITEFPFFSFLFADLHPHMMAIPFALLSLSLALNIAVAGSSRIHFPEFALALTALAFVIGALWPMNAWDLPTYLAVALAAMVGGDYLRHGKLNPRILARWMGLGILVVVLGLVFWLPYHLRLESPLDILVTSPAQTPLRQYLAIHGLLLFLGVSLMLTLVWGQTRSMLRKALDGLTIRMQPGMFWLVCGIVLVFLTMLLSLAAFGYVTVAFLTLLFFLLPLLIWSELSNSLLNVTESPGLPYKLFPFLLLGMAFAIGIAVDLVVVGRDIERLNTVFKLYLQGWVLLAIAGSYALWRLGFVEGLFRKIRLRKGGWIGTLILLVVSAGIFPLLGTLDRLQERFEEMPLTLDGMAFMTNAVYQDANGPIILERDRVAIEWLQGAVEGSPVILEAVTPEYRWGARISTYTGLPTILGWPFHEAHRKCGLNSCNPVYTRKEDVASIYTTLDPVKALNLLEKYNVVYIYVGENERLYYPGEGLEKFADMTEEEQLVVVYEARGVTIYQIPD
jgi:YYY domain-containing protein